MRRAAPAAKVATELCRLWGAQGQGWALEPRGPCTGAAPPGPKPCCCPLGSPLGCAVGLVEGIGVVVGVIRPTPAPTSRALRPANLGVPSPVAGSHPAAAAQPILLFGLLLGEVLLSAVQVVVVVPLK